MNSTHVAWFPRAIDVRYLATNERAKPSPHKTTKIWHIRIIISHTDLFCFVQVNYNSNGFTWRLKRLFPPVRTEICMRTIYVALALMYTWYDAYLINYALGCISSILSMYTVCGFMLQFWADGFDEDSLFISLIYCICGTLVPLEERSLLKLIQPPISFLRIF